MNTIKKSASYVIACLMALALGLSTTVYSSEKRMKNTKTIQKAPVSSAKEFKPASKMTKSRAKQVKYVVIPYLMGKTLKEAKKTLGKAGLNVGRIHNTPLGKGKPFTVIRQQPPAMAKLSKGTRVNLWILKSKPRNFIKIPKRNLTRVPKKVGSKYKPKIKKRGKKTFLEFPVNVESVTIYSTKGLKLQEFKSGRRFNVTKSVKKSKAGRARVLFLPKFGSKNKGSHFTPSHSADIDFGLGVDPEDLVDNPSQLPQTQFPREDIQQIIIHDYDTIENGEPANDTINGATQLSGAMYFHGEVGGNGDPYDYLKITVSGHLPGTLVRVPVISGNVELTLYGPHLAPLASSSNQVWIAIKNNKSFYIRVRPVSGQSQYSISVYYKRIKDSFEPNSDRNQAKTISLGTPIEATLCYLWDHDDRDWSGRTDRFKVNITQANRYRILLYGFPSSMSTNVQIQNYNNYCHYESVQVTSGIADFDIDLENPDPHCGSFTPGWYSITIGVAPTDNPYGAGDPPENYEPYTLLVHGFP